MRRIGVTLAALLIGAGSASAQQVRYTPGAGGGAASPLMSSVAAGSITGTGATITWTTAPAGDSQVCSGTSANPYPGGTCTSVTDTTPTVTSHSVPLTGLTASQTYHYQAVSNQAGTGYANKTVSADATFTTSSGAGAIGPAPVVDGTCGTGALACGASFLTGGGTTIAATVSSASAAGCLVVFVSNSLVSGVNTVASVAKTSGTGTVGAFTKRTSISAQAVGQFGTSWVDLEEWSAAYTAQLSSAVITATTNSAIDASTIQAIAVTGTFGNGCSFDTHAPATGNGAMTAGVLNLTQSTNAKYDLLVSAIGADGLYSNNPDVYGGVTGALTDNVLNANGSCCGNSLGGSYLGVSAIQTGITTAVQFVNAVSFNANGIADALTGP